MKILLWDGIAPPPSFDAGLQVAAAATWQASLEKISEQIACGSARVNQLALLCHGAAANLALGEGIVSEHDCQCFAIGLRALMSERGLIELLVPRVAAIDLQRADERKEASEIPLDAARQYFTAAFDQGRSGSAGKPAARPGSASQKVSPNERERLLQTRLPFAGNGLRFCFLLATVSGCFVRACDGNQAPILAGPTDRTDAAQHDEGDCFLVWKGQVWDFGPDGSIHHLGREMQRAGLALPPHWCGPALPV